MSSPLSSWSFSHDLLVNEDHYIVVPKPLSLTVFTPPIFARDWAFFENGTHDENDKSQDMTWQESADELTVDVNISYNYDF